MPTRFYHRSSTSTNAPSTGTNSAVWPNGTQNSLTSFQSQLMDDSVPPANEAFTATVSTLAQTARQSGILARFTSPALASQTLSSGTWTSLVEGNESNNNANFFYGLSIYIWRPSTSSVVGYIYDNTAQLSTELATSTASRTLSVSGSGVSIDENDVLVTEYWYTAQQGKATSYTLNSYFVDMLFSYGGENFSYIEAPQDITLAGGAARRRIIIIS
jgi:hypothetical protein